MWETRGDVRELDFSEQHSPSANGTGNVAALNMKSKMEDSESDDEEVLGHCAWQMLALVTRFVKLE